jgi:hypothetical protein
LTWSEISLPSTLDSSVNSIIEVSPGVLLCCDRSQIFKSTNGGAVWVEIAHGVSIGGGESFRNLATDGAGTVMAAMQSTLARYAISSDDGDTWADFNTGIGTRNPQRVSYANGQYIMAYSLPVISYSATGASGSWTHPTQFTAFTGSTGDYVWDGTRYWGMSYDHLGHYIQSSLADNPTINATAPPGLITHGFIYALGLMIFVTDFPAIRTTSGAIYTATTSQAIPDVGGSGYTFELYAIAFRAEV